MNALVSRLVPKLVSLYRSRWFRRTVPTLFLVVSLAAMGRTILTQFAGIHASISTLRYEFVIAGFFTLALSAIGGGIYWRCLLRSCGSSLGTFAAVRIWCLSTISKYGLGIVWQYAGRLYLAERAGVGRRVVVASVALELGLIAFSGVVLAATLGSLRSGQVTPGVLGPSLTLWLVAALGVAFLLVGRPLLRQLLGEPSAINGAGLLWFAIATGIVVVNWLLLGAAAYFLALAVAPLPLSAYLPIVVSVTLAVLAGLIAVTPLGVGVRDVTLILLLGQIVPLPEATIISLLHRLLGVVAEFVCAGAVLVVLPPSDPGEKRGGSASAVQKVS
jgi:glycosyltransferase 2 family protein